MKILFLVSLLVFPLAAQTLSKDQIKARIEASKAAEGDEIGAEAAKVWGEALVELEAAAGALKMEATAIEDLKALEKPVSLVVPKELPATASKADQEAFLQRIEALLDENSARIKDRPEESAILNSEELKVKAQLDSLEIPAVATGEMEVAKYQKAVQMKARLEAKLREIAAKKELNEKAVKLFEERIPDANRYDANLKELLRSVESRIEKIKEEEAEATRKVIVELGQEFESIPEFAEVVEELREIRTTQDRVEKMLAKAKAYDARVEEIGNSIEKQHKSAQERISLLKAASLEVDDETGMLLRRQRARLPSVDEITNELRLNLELVAKAEISLIDVADRLKTLPVISDERIATVIEEHPNITQERIDQLMKRRRDSLSKLSKEYRNLNKELNKGTAAAKQTILDIKEYSKYIDERLLWIKSAKPFGWPEPVDEWSRVLKLVGPGKLVILRDSIRANFFKNSVQVILVGIVSLAILLRRRKLFEMLKTSSEKAARRNCTSLKPTLEFLGAAILLSLWLPILVWVLSDLTEGSLAWREGLLRLSVFLFLSSLFLKFSRPDGLFVNHFKIHPDRAALFYQNLKWLAHIAPAFVFFVPALTLVDSDPAAGRSVFILGMLLLAGFCHHLFHPKRSILQSEGKSTGFTKSCYFLIMSCAVIFVIGAILGYFESVLTLRDQVVATAGLLVFGFLVIRFLTRWTLVSRRGLAITQALRRREATLAERAGAKKGDDKEADLPSPEEVKAEAVNVVEVEEQTTKLLKMGVYAAVFFGLWGVWESTMPALSVLDKVQLWSDGSAQPAGAPAPSLIPGMSSGAAETPSLAAETSPTSEGWITLQDVLLTLVFLILTFVAARNIPGVLSLTLFNRIKLGPGGNFALTTTVRYLIVFTGIIIALGQIGITWGKVQWLAAAVTLGIGFGLQEIFANFVAGIILLFERPIRLGDIVTVGDISGKVTQIRIRATTIQQFNNRELLVPNKEFITSQLVNWTLNDSILRLEVPVGIAYGSDTDKATEILRQILDDHPNVMSEPGPNVFFMSFGNSTLDFEARGFVASADILLSTKSELHYLIDDAFRKAEIEIAFPQQDVHLRSFPEGLKLGKG